MINLFNKNVLSLKTEGGIKEDEYRLSKEYKDIENAVKTLNKHFESLHISGFSKSKVGVTYSQAPEDDEALKGIDDIERRKFVARGGAACTDIAKLLISLNEHYGIDPEHAIQTISAAFAFFGDCPNLQEAEKALNKMSKAKNTKEAIEIVKKSSKKAANILNNKEDELVDNSYEDGGDNHDWVEKICDKISRKTGKSVVISLVDINGLSESTCEVGLRFNDSIYKNSKDTGISVDKIELAIIGGTATSLMEHAHKEFNIPKGFFKDYCELAEL